MAAGVNILCIHQQAHGADDLRIIFPQNIVGSDQFLVFLNQQPAQHPIQNHRRRLPRKNLQQLALVVLRGPFCLNAQISGDFFFIDNRRDNPISFCLNDILPDLLLEKRIWILQRRRANGANEIGAGLLRRRLLQKAFPL